MATTQNTLENSVNEAIAELAKYKKSLYEWENDKTYLLVSSNPNGSYSSSTISEYYKIVNYITERKKQVTYWETELERRKKALFDFQATSPEYQEQVKQEKAQKQKTFYIIAGIVILITVAIIVTVINKKKSVTPK